MTRRTHTLAHDRVWTHGYALTQAERDALVAQHVITLPAPAVALTDKQVASLKYARSCLAARAGVRTRELRAKGLPVHPSVRYIVSPA